MRAHKQLELLVHEVRRAKIGANWSKTDVDPIGERITQAELEQAVSEANKSHARWYKERHTRFGK